MEPEDPLRRLRVFLIVLCVVVALVSFAIIGFPLLAIYVMGGS